MRRTLLIVAVVAVAGVGAWFALRGRGGDHTREGLTTSGSATTSGTTAGNGTNLTTSSPTAMVREPSLPSTGGSGGSGSSAPESSEAQRAAEVARANTELAKSSPVPINSRPLLESESLFLAPNARSDQLTPGQPTKAADGKPAERGNKPELYFLFTGDRVALVGTDVLTTSLQAWSDELRTTPAEIKVTGATVARSSDPGKRLATLTFAPGASGAHTSTWSPSSSGLGTGDYALAVTFLGPSGAEFEASLVARYTAKADVPARFTKLTDRLDKGSLVVAAGLDVIDAGEYIIDANLFDSANKPIARANFRGEIKKGAQTVDLVFYGNIIREHGVPGPYVVRTLRGYLTRPGQQPNRVDMVSHPTDFTTKAYTVDQFTSEPWPTPGKPITPSSP